METTGHMRREKSWTGLNRTMQYGNLRENENNSPQSFPFKSYYVVWKHFLKNKNTVDEKGLNRTMQYGNELSSHLPTADILV